MIDINKQYRTRYGHNVRIYADDGEPEYPIHGAYLGGDGYWESNEWTPCGQNETGVSNAPLDLIERTPYDHIKKGEPVYVRVVNGSWVIRIFSHVGNDEKAFTFLDGETIGDVVDWDECLTIDEWNERDNGDG